MPTFDPEDIIISGSTFPAILNETSMGSELGTGAMNTERTLTAQFPSSSFLAKLKSGMTVHARGEKWQISSDGGAIQKDRASTIIVLVEPERREG